jgi:hypothetical protein
MCATQGCFDAFDCIFLHGCFTSCTNLHCM